MNIGLVVEMLRSMYKSSSDYLSWIIICGLRFQLPDSAFSDKQQWQLKSLDSFYPQGD